MRISPALLLRASFVDRSAASKARKLRGSAPSAPSSSTNSPPASPPPSTPKIAPTSEAEASRQTADVANGLKPQSSGRPLRAIPKATPFEAPRSRMRRAGDAFREPPAVEAARKKSVGQRSIWESYLILTWKTRLYLWLGIGAFALIGLYGGDYLFPETEEEKAAYEAGVLPPLTGGPASGEHRDRGGDGPDPSKQV